MDTITKYFGIIALLATMLLVSGCGNTYVVKDTNLNTISVTGSSDLSSAPDQVQITVAVETSSTTAKQAKDQNAKTLDSVRRALKAKGIADDDMETAYFNIRPDHEWNRELEKNELIGYTATQTLRVTSRDITKAGDIIDTAVNAGANSIGSIVFGLTKETQSEVNNKALEAAALKAQEKAKALAKTLDVNIGKVVSISESNTEFFAYTPPVARLAMAEDLAEKTVISPGDVSTTGQVSISFEIV